MIYRLATALAVATVALSATAGAERMQERNFWPFWVGQSSDAAGVERWSALGPILHGSRDNQGDSLLGVRPLFQEITTAGGSSARSIIYPLWYHEYDVPTDETRWTILNLINSTSGDAQDDHFSIWPVYFSRDTGETESSYRAVFPIYGDINQRFGQSRITWALFPLYVRYENGGAITTSTPWPFIKNHHGDGYRGFAFWPLLGEREEVGVSSSQYLLWPLIYQQVDQLDTAAPSTRLGVLPFYASETSPGFESKTLLWPFLGYSQRTSPTRYNQTNWLWPLWVQGRGETRYVNRWAPFFSYSKSLSREQTWVAWPLWRDRQWQSERLDHHRQQFLYFVYHSEVQTSRQSPDIRPAVKRHLWPMVSHWNNGAGRVQTQLLSPLEVFFPHNERARQMWSPLFALYRYNQTEPGEYRHSLLWDAVTYTQSETRQSREFHLGPLFHYRADPAGTQWGILAGLLRINRPADQGLRASSILTDRFLP
jgi:hypothetical protein